MGGITGWVDWARDLGAREATITSMTDTLAHRGPDGAGTWSSPHCLLGHRGRAAPDPGGTQPMASGDHDPAAVIAFSGGIRDHDRLRAHLTARGHRFRTRTEAEVLLRGYLEWGERLVEHLAGVFAFAVWDDREQSLLLARDHLGVQPLYYAELPDGLLFGSEPKAVLAHPGFHARVGADGLTDVFVVGARRPGDAVYTDLKEVVPGWTLRVDRNGLHHRRYWALESAPHEDDAATTARTVHDLLDEVVRAESAADVPLGVLVSGGLDSSALAALAARHRAGPLHSYSVDFAGSDTDFRADALHVSRDEPYIAAVVEHLGTRHRGVVLDAPSLLDELRTTLRARDVPGVGDLDVSLHLLFREVRRDAAVVLSGEGADDVFGGYPWFLAEAERPTRNFPWSAGVTDRNAMLSADLRAHLDLDSAVAERYAAALAEVPALPGEHGVDRRMREVFHLQLTRFLPFLLDRTDRMGMAAGLEVRLPFCDHRLVDYAWNIPWSVQRVGGREKGVLRAAVAGLLPEKVVNRPKSGFPVGQSPKYLHAVRDAVRELLDDPSSPARPLFNEHAMRELVDGERWSAGTFTPPPWLPRALLLDAWLREYRVDVVL
ncbi:asparagine synthase (glutamine-hydrolyzing) [Saccharothrix obliqua]|uniref:asparagine synthase (glutamine-hydrolyzing) n=1 Tax=Saccharothrix obliqua TaxID=2861747 RepID=UPI001C5D82CD|nr:asparagine synthase (glutamine-hydrolyzing) [Saccharothrix obliqua]MBW4721480.1 asparagine synthase (glutamine-hydrolyzing) [Saccharothrix obliqua]